MNRRQIVLGVVVAVAVVLVLLVGFALGRSGDGDDAERSASAITATGTGKVKAVPDVAEVTLGVSATARRAQAAGARRTGSSRACSPC